MSILEGNNRLEHLALIQTTTLRGFTLFGLIPLDSADKFGCILLFLRFFKVFKDLLAKARNASFKHFRFTAVMGGGNTMFYGL